MAVSSAVIGREVVRSCRKRKPRRRALGGRPVGVIHGQNLEFLSEALVAEMAGLYFSRVGRPSR